jgi:hypothetical protein
VSLRARGMHGGVLSVAISRSRRRLHACDCPGQKPSKRAVHRNPHRETNHCGKHEGHVTAPASADRRAGLSVLRGTWRPRPYEGGGHNVILHGHLRFL